MIHTWSASQKIRSNTLALLAIAATAILCLAGCAGVPESRPVPPLDKIVWPPPPQEARIAWVQAIASPGDAGVRKGFWGRVWSAVVGEKESRIVRPYGIHVDRKKRVLIADTGGRSVHVIDRTAGRYELVHGAEESGFISPVGIAEDAFENVYVTDSTAGKIFRFSIKDLKVEPFIATGIQRPTGIVYNPLNQLIYVSDTVACQVVVFTTQGKEAFRFGSQGEKPGRFNRPTDLAVDARGRIFVTDALNGRVQIFSASGVYQKAFGERGDGSGHFAKPKGIAVDSEGHVYVCDALFDTVQIFNEKGELLLSFGNRGGGNGELWMPSGLFIDRDDIIYVADTYNNRIQVFQYVWEAWKD